MHSAFDTTFFEVYKDSIYYREVERKLIKAIKRGATTLKDIYNKFSINKKQIYDEIYYKLCKYNNGRRIQNFYIYTYNRHYFSLVWFADNGYAYIFNPVNNIVTKYDKEILK